MKVSSPIRTRGAYTALVFAVALGLAWSCGGDSTSNGPTGTTTTGTTKDTTTSTSNAISVNDDFFAPASTAVAVGTTVTWTFMGAVPHNVTFDDGVRSADQVDGTFSRTFSTAGTFHYHCTIHGLAMSGTVTVR